MDPNNKEALTSKGAALYYQGKYAEAITYYDKALAVDPNAEEKENNTTHYSLWMYHFPWPFYQQLTPPYSSALAQSAGIKILIFAHNLTGDKKYLDAAYKAFGSFLVNYDKGGVITREESKEDC